MSETQARTPAVAPGGTIGILGGGQLGRMLALAAARLGLKTHIYSDEKDAPAFQVAHQKTFGAFTDADGLRKFASACDAVTFEFENVPEEAVAHIAKYTRAHPGAAALRTTQDRLSEKDFVTSLGFRTPKYLRVDSGREARDAIRGLGGAAILKTRRFGYDGKGQAKVATPDEAERAFARFGAPAILEEFVPFDYEASVVAARAADSSFRAYDTIENVHGDHILRRSTVPSRLNARQTEQAVEIAKRIADGLDYVGVLAVELFIAKDGALLVNEIAPRVHNSGHWTLDACSISQFEQHIRAVSGWPLGDPSRHSNAVMENIIGDEVNDWLKLAERGALHLYGKNEAKPGRKMGHVTVLSPLTR